MLFYGDTGLGKSFMSNCIAKALMDTRHTVLYQSAIHLFEEVCGDAVMNKSGNPKNKEIYDYLYRCDLLIIDDLGTEMNNAFTNTALFECLNERLIHQKSTIISTNFSLKELQERYEERIFSRTVGNYTPLKIFGDDIRKKKTLIN